MNTIQIASTTELLDETILEKVIKDTSVILVKQNDKIRVYSGKCPHQGASLAQGTIKNKHIVCPLHGKNFSCDTGKDADSDLCLKEYQINIEGDSILFDINQFNDQSIETPSEKIIKISDLPSPKGKFLTGHLSEFKKKNKHQILEAWAKELGDIYHINLMGKKILVSANPEFNGQVLKNRPVNFRRYSKIKEVMDEMGIEGVFSAEGDQWKLHRKFTTEALNFKNVKAYFPILQKMTDRLYNRWERMVTENKVINVQEEMILYTVDITTFIAFGYDSNTLESTGDIIQNHLKKIFPKLDSRIVSPFPFWRYFKTKSDKALDYSLIQIQETMNQYVDVAKKRMEQNPSLKENPSNFLEALLVQQENDSSFRDKDIFGNVFTLLLAGEDTTSNSISWSLYYLATNPLVKAKLYNEVNSILGDQKMALNNEQLDSLKYTEAVAMEALRINPTTPTLIMQANKDIIIDGIEIPKDMTIILQNKVAQTDERNFSKPNDFLPERWMQSGCPMHGNHNEEAIRVFGGGPRFCPGKNLAIQEMKMALAMICKNFDFEMIVKKEDVKEIFAFTMYPENLIMKLKIKNVPALLKNEPVISL